MAKVVINTERCKGCKLCTKVCPKKILVMKNDVFNDKGYYPASVIDVEKCVTCGFCVTICADCAIEVDGR